MVKCSGYTQIFVKDRELFIILNMKRHKIFLASSSELKEDRDKFEVFISRKNKDLITQDIFIELVMWEDFIDAMSTSRLQDEYNKAITECDIFILLFFTKVGKYTEEEFEHAFAHFKVNNRPLVYTYFKDAAINTGMLDDNVLSLLQFKKKLGDLGHFYTEYKNIDELKFHFDQQLGKLGFFKFDVQAKGNEAPSVIIKDSENVNIGSINSDGNVIIGNTNRNS